MRLLLWLMATATASAFSLFPSSRTTTTLSASSSSSSASQTTFPKPESLTKPICEYHVLTIPMPVSPNFQPQQEIHVIDVTPIIQKLLEQTGLQHGLLTVTSRHTTTGITINEQESRLARDLQEWLLQLAPPDERSVAARQTGVRYQHNDLDQRPESAAEEQRCLENGWNIHDPVQLAAWRAQEPINAHSHLAAMLLGSTESIPVVEGKLTLGSWQSILLVDLDGPRERTVGVQVMGYL
ncbi:hypothetical protein FisN_26Hh061 [Fistulifera solaris]|uniref:Secondary thiamine-phosphate synthase enzyme n=1 Tax=Fistulifera solaris TaxID=1519565 RepID=A0A1Z5JXL2_FISSO|nr:hypothetical protein FisN_26Hh061 [Fistulifera solaris]|eukprot:GAX18765.1 hypothetical protein FisN_26Hh061 [Fistulifera solaris]